MTTSTPLEKARAGDELAFRELTDAHRRELQVHCYRILGSVQDAEDALQETLLAAWRGLDGFEERSSLRAWLYTIATNRCLNTLRAGARRPQEQRPLTFQPPEPTRYGELAWLEPYPDALLEGVPDAAPGPDARYESHETIALAFVTALQRLPPRQRAALVLRDVLGYRAAEVASMLDTTETSVNSALQRARATLDAQAPPVRERAPLPRSPAERELVSQFADAFENSRVEQIVALLTDDAWVTMPPEPFEYQGPAAIAEFFTHAFIGRPHDRTDRLVATRANGQPAFGHYIGDVHAPIVRGVGVIVLTLGGDRISHLVRFGGSAQLARFGLPRTLPL
ncbi:MAG TPA: sigma-70 family RNA polymerase sigma factor [Solirubrobacteraceae bacterium]|nr:sigma-70 family RNA polymerase sigma factor [Solirubrobacteraceae bacterium]